MATRRKTESSRLRLKQKTRSQLRGASQKRRELQLGRRSRDIRRRVAPRSTPEIGEVLRVGRRQAEIGAESEPG